ncbi:MAG TPA: transporter [Dongiaceae bacterium]|nr:transporter [Dongiaceae bacterium]
MRRLYGPLVLSCLCVMGIAKESRADDTDLDQRLKALEKVVQDQQQKIDQQQKMLNDQHQELQSINALNLDSIRGLGIGNNRADKPAPSGSPQQADTSTPSQPVGQGPKQERPQVTVISEQGGVLTPAGHLILEPSIEYLHDSTNKLTFRGVSLQDTVLIGVIEASEADRELVEPAITARYGITSRWDVDIKVPYVYRSDQLTFLIPQSGQPDLQRKSSLTGNNLGDIELATHYQINDRPPYFVGNLTFKTTTGQGPFDIKRDSQGVDEELATGSGFYSLEPSLTLLYPTDPAVLFATLSYQWNIGQDVNKNIGAVKVGHVDPGDDLGITVGMGFSVNDDFSFSLGFKYDLIFETSTDVTSQGQKRTETSDQLHLGQLLFGMGYRVSPDINVNLDLQLGVTDDTPDMQATIRVPIAFDLF